MKKKSILSFLLVMLLLLSACTNGTTPQEKDVLDPTNPVTLTLWHYYVGENQRALEASVTKFNETVGIEKGIIVDPVAKGSISELEAAVTDSAKGVINSAAMPDIFSSYADKAMALDAMDVLCDLSTYFTVSEQAEYVQGFIADGIFDGTRLLLIPIVKSTELMYINDTEWQKFVESENVSEDALLHWESVFDTARAYYEWTDAQTPDVKWDGTALIGIDSVANFIIISAKQQGVDVIDGDGKCANLDEGALRNIFDIYVKGLSIGYFNQVGQFRSDDIKAGELIAYVGSSSSAAYFPTWIAVDNVQSEIDFKAAAYPYFKDGTPMAVQQGAGMCVAKSTAQRELASSIFLKWFTSPEQNISFAMTTGYLPVKTAAYESQDFEDALNELKTGEKAQNNVSQVYTIALHQITEADAYAAKPFDGSYDVRSILQSTLTAAMNSGRDAAKSLKEQGLDEEAIFEAMDIDARFDNWMKEIKSALDEKEIPWK